MPWIIQLIGAAAALFGLAFKVRELKASEAAVFLSGPAYLAMVVGLSLILLGIGLQFFVLPENPTSSEGGDSSPRP